MNNSHLTMISYEYLRGIPYNKELASVIGVDYSNHRDEIRIDPVRVSLNEWSEEVNLVHDCCGNGDCRRCSNNEDYDVEYLSIKTQSREFLFRRTKSHQLGHIWTNWYDISDAITPA